MRKGVAYTASFGEQWQRYRRTQLDSVNGTTLTSSRLYTNTGWTPQELAGQRILDAGCGAGRFTEILLEAGAEVWAVDASRAVDACAANHGASARLHVIQADLLHLPFRRHGFDKILCYGVLQHTPDPGRTFAALAPLLKPGGAIAIDVYLRSPWIYRWTAKYWYRWLTKRLPRMMLQRLVSWYVPKATVVDERCRRVPVLRRLWPALVPLPFNGRTAPALTPEQRREWAILDAFDALSAWHDHPQTLRAVRGWCVEAGLSQIDVRVGGNGILGNATAPQPRPAAVGIATAMAELIP